MLKKRISPVIDGFGAHSALGEKDMVFSCPNYKRGRGRRSIIENKLIVFKIIYTEF